VSGTDRRSVGELLLDCDLTTRRLLIDPDALDAAALVRAWPEVVQAAHEFLQALPSHHPAPGPRAVGAARGGDLTGERLHIMATAMHAGLRQRLWPGDGPGDDQLLAVAGNLVRAHDLVRQHLRPSDRPAPAVLADAAAARTWVLHALYVGSHAIQLAVRAQVRDVQIRSHALSPRRVRSQLNALQFVTDRLGAFEQVAGAEVYRAFPGAMAGERREPPAPERLSTAFAAWDVEAHRALARQPSMANLAELTRVQTSTLAHTGVILDAATEHRIIDARTYRAQLEPRLTTAETAWGALHATFRDLTGRAHRAVSPDLRVAGAELVHALSEIVLDGTAVRNPTTIAARVDLTPTARTLVGTLASPHQVSLLLLDAALDPRIRVNAKAAQPLIGQLATTPESSVLASPQESWIDPRDLSAGRDIAPPAPLRGLITEQVTAVGGSSHALAATASTVTTAGPPTAPDRNLSQEPNPLRPRDRSGPVPPRAASTVRR